MSNVLCVFSLLPCCPNLHSVVAGVKLLPDRKCNAAREIPEDSTDDEILETHIWAFTGTLTQCWKIQMDQKSHLTPKHNENKRKYNQKIHHTVIISKANISAYCKAFPIIIKIIKTYSAHFKSVLQSISQKSMNQYNLQIQTKQIENKTESTNKTR